MNDTPDRLADALRRAIREAMGRSHALRDVLVELAEFVLAEVEAGRDTTGAGGRVAPADTPDDDQATDAAEPADLGDVTGDGAADETTEDAPVTASLPMILAGGATEVRVTGSASDIAEARRTAAGPADDDGPRQQAPRPRSIDLGLVVRRTRLKAESCRFFIERRHDRDDPVREPALKTRLDEMIATAKRDMSDCFLWVLWPHEEQPPDDRLREIASCYDAVAESAALCERAIDPDGRLSNGEVQQAFQLLAEASSALRVALGATWLTDDDTDQEESHLWLRRETSVRGIFVERHMKLDDPAVPARAGEVIAEAKRLLAMNDARVTSARKIDQLFNKAAYHARRVRNDPEPDRHDFETINVVMEELRTRGIGPTDVRVAEFREGLDGIEFPTDLPPHDHLTFESRPTNATPSDTTPHWSERVGDARQLLEGGRIVVIGGESRPEAIARMEDAFGATVEWVELTEHGSGARMQAPIERPDTRVVLLLIKLTGHLHADEAREYARAAGVPCINMEAGYNPNMIAEQVIGQAGVRLAAGAHGSDGAKAT